jgi:hypothetical protein
MTTRGRLLSALVTGSSVLLAQVAAAAAVGEWKVKTEIDALTDQTRQVATVTNADGFTFSIYRTGRGVWANFSLPHSDPESLDPTKLIQFRIDKYPAQGLESWVDVKRDLGLQLFDVQPKWINFALPPSGGGESEVTRHRLQKGSTLLVRFYLFTGGSRDTTFPLKGARQAIAVATGTPETWDEVEEERLEELRAHHREFEKGWSTAWSSAVASCRHGHDANAQLSCTMKMGDCKRKYENAGDSMDTLRSFISCTQAVTP